MGNLFGARRIRGLRIRFLGDHSLEDQAWRLGGKMDWPDIHQVEYIALTQLRADALVTVNTKLAAAACHRGRPRDLHAHPGPRTLTVIGDVPIRHPAALGQAGLMRRQVDAVAKFERAHLQGPIQVPGHHDHGAWIAEGRRGESENETIVQLPGVLLV